MFNNCEHYACSTSVAEHEGWLRGFDSDLVMAPVIFRLSVFVKSIVHRAMYGAFEEHVSFMVDMANMICFECAQCAQIYPCVHIVSIANKERFRRFFLSGHG